VSAGKGNGEGKHESKFDSQKELHIVGNTIARDFGKELDRFE
jgi:hypothetical protein